MTFEETYKSWDLYGKLEFYGLDIEVKKENAPRISSVQMFDGEFIRIYDEGPGPNEHARYRLVLHTPIDEVGDSAVHRDVERKGWRLTAILQTDLDEVVVSIIMQIHTSALRL